MPSRLVEYVVCLWKNIVFCANHQLSLVESKVWECKKKKKFKKYVSGIQCGSQDYLTFLFFFFFHLYIPVPYISNYLANILHLRGQCPKTERSYPRVSIFSKPLSDHCITTNCFGMLYVGICIWYMARLYDNIVRNPLSQLFLIMWNIMWNSSW